MKSKTPQEVTKAKELDKKIREFQVAQRANWWEMGSAVLLMQRQKAYQLIGYTTFELWQNSLGESRALIFEAKSLVEAFQDIPKEKRGYLIGCSKENLKLLAKLPTRQRFADAYLNAAAKLKTKDLRSKLDDRGYHLDKNTFYKFSGVPMGAIEIVEQAHDRAKLLCKTPVDQGGIHPLELIAKTFNDWFDANVDEKKLRRAK